ncbi:MAG: hypothetical protein J0M24_14935 [Verrucomicrobia bacterium]|nr:hypothetical protein [Verrucomicrobiota bacterium]
MSLQHLASHAGLRRLVLSFGAGLVTCLLVLAGVLAANPVWHEVLHDHDQKPGSCAGTHKDSPCDSSEPEAGCGVCAFALQHVDLVGLEPVTVLISGHWTEVGFAGSLVMVPQRSDLSGHGRGPPVGEA